MILASETINPSIDVASNNNNNNNKKLNYLMAAAASYLNYLYLFFCSLLYFSWLYFCRFVCLKINFVNILIKFFEIRIREMNRRKGDGDG